MSVQREGGGGGWRRVQKAAMLFLRASPAAVEETTSIEQRGEEREEGKGDIKKLLSLTVCFLCSHVKKKKPRSSSW